MNLYLSEFSVSSSIAQHPIYEEAIHSVLSFCAKNSVDCLRSNEFTDYAEIEKGIRGSDIFVALIDCYWSSSSWKAHEFMYSDGGISLVDGTRGKKISKRISLLVEGYELPAALRGDFASTVIARNISELNNALSQTIPA
jgi:hypothetical protein